jgi:hypothetical protein
MALTCRHDFDVVSRDGWPQFGYKLAAELEADEDELLLLADKVSDAIRKRIQDNPEAFRLLATMTDDALEALVLRHQQATKSAKH